MDSEEKLEVYHEELISASSNSDNSKVMELSKIIGDLEKEVEEQFERLEVVQTELDEILEKYDSKLSELDG